MSISVNVHFYFKAMTNDWAGWGSRRSLKRLAWRHPKFLYWIHFGCRKAAFELRFNVFVAALCISNSSNCLRDEGITCSCMLYLHILDP